MTAQLASALSSPDYYNCQMHPGLARKQREICVRHPAAMRAISGNEEENVEFESEQSRLEGLRDAIDECHAQFERVSWRRGLIER